jgi:predicted transport protein
VSKISSQKNIKETKNYTINQYMDKCNEETKALFCKIRNEIFKLDSIIRENPVSWYVGYKFEKHLICTIQVSNKQLRIDTRCHKIYDPKKLVTITPDKWKMGSTPVWYWYISKEADVAYTMSLIKQGYKTAKDRYQQPLL